MSYLVKIAPAARKQISKLTSNVQKRILKRLDRLEENPRPPGAEKLSGIEKLYRIRVGNYRVVYRIEDQVLVVLVLKVGDRKDVYRNLPT